MKNKLWYNIYGDGNMDNNILLAKVKSKGLAYIVAETLKQTYKNVRIE